MINVLAGSDNDAARIAGAAGNAARVVADAAQFTNGDAPVECLILGCRRAGRAVVQERTSERHHCQEVRGVRSVGNAGCIGSH